MDITLTHKQKKFIDSPAFETLYGGAAGGGKSYGQILDAFLYAIKYAGSKQLLLRRTFPELESTLIALSLRVFPNDVATYNDAKHRWKFKNGSEVIFGYCDREKDVYRYQGAEYDCIRFDELTHFTEKMYIYLFSRVRGANDFPKCVKSSTNPGGVGHTWVKERFIDPAPPGTLFTSGDNTRLFIPSSVTDNRFLMQNDPDYIKRLEMLPDAERRALLYGDWDIFDGVYFDEFRRDIHVIKPFDVPKHWKKYLAIDYGLDALAALVVAFAPDGMAYVMREEFETNLVISQAARRIKNLIDDIEIYRMVAPPDLAGRSRDSGKSQLELFAENGLRFDVADADRVTGWMNLKEWLHPYTDPNTGDTVANLRIFDNCRELIRSLPALQRDDKKPSDCAIQPHDITHAPDALRYLMSERPNGRMRLLETKDEAWYFSQVGDVLSYGT